MKKFVILSLTSYLFFIPHLYNAPSTFDSSFSGDGAVTSVFEATTTNQAIDIAVQSDGKIVAVGNCGSNGVIARYNNDGSYDLNFNGQGYLKIALGFPTTLLNVTIQPADNKILVAGYAIISNSFYGFLARYNSNGIIDSTFNTTGYIISPFQIQAQFLGMALQTNGSIVVAGWTIEEGQTQALVARYSNAGLLDTSFGNGIGYITTLIGGVFTIAEDVIIQNDGKIVITGQSQASPTDINQGLIVIRYNTDGSLDTNFNTNDTPGSIFPFTTIDGFVSSQGNALTLQLNGSIVVVGYTNTTDFTTANRSYTVVRLQTNGTLDLTFNSSGYTINQNALQAQGVVMQPNGQIVTCGFNYISAYIPIVIRYNNNGSIDSTFTFPVNTTTQNSLGNAVTLQIDGKIVITGTIATS